jgi:hypothetical protein
VLLQATSTFGKARKFGSLTEAVAQRIESNQELSTATDEAKRFMKGQSHVEELVSRTDAERTKGNLNLLRGISFRTRLREIAMTQMRELTQLSREKEIWIKRSFPTFAEIRKRT